MEKLFKKMIVDGFFNRLLLHNPKRLSKHMQLLEQLKHIKGVRPGHVLAAIEKAWPLLTETGKEDLQYLLENNSFQFYYYIEDASWLPNGIISEIQGSFYRISHNIILEISTENDWVIAIFNIPSFLDLLISNGIGLFLTDLEDCHEDIGMNTDLLTKCKEKITSITLGLSKKELKLRRLWKN